MKTVLITGAAGLIGKACAEMLLQKGFNVIGTDDAPQPIDNPKFSYIQCSIADKDKITGVLEGSRIDALVHLACSVDNDFSPIITSEYEKISATADKYIYKTAVSAGVKDVIMLSTHQIYATPRSREPIRETAPEKPTTAYAKIKNDSEKAISSALKKASASYGVIMRVCPVYTKNFSENLKAKVYDPKEGCAFIYGYGDYGYSFTCVYNIVDFIYGILVCEDGINYEGIYNVCDSKPIAAKEIVEALRSEHKIGAVVQRNYGTDSIKGAAIFALKSAKTDYRYNDLSIACSNISYDNTKAQRISTFRWKLSNTK